MSWGHAVKRDLAHWEELAVALAEENGIMILPGTVVDERDTSGFCTAGKPCMVARHNEITVGAIYDEFEQQLEAWRKQYAGQPRREMIRLCLLALEREELVSVAYREDLMAKRLASMPVNKQVREIVRHALMWAWKDEEMHAIYIRGLILKLGSRPCDGLESRGGSGRPYPCVRPRLILGLPIRRAWILKW
jgi:hypothetical protein